MLAYLALTSRPLSRPTLIAACLLGLLVGRQALAADMLPIGNVDARATAKVSTGDTAKAGAMTTGVSFEGAEAVATRSALADDTANGDGNDKTLLRDANRATVFLGGALTDNLELTLGLQGSFEHVKPADRDLVFDSDAANDAAVDGADEGWQGNVKETGFSGASLFLKYKLLDASGFRLAFAPFVESGAGEQATYSLTRSVGPKAGFMGIASYGAAGVADLSVNAGYRYRDPELVGDIAIRNEQFAKVAARGYLSRNFSLFVAGEGRRLMVANANELDIESGKRLYKAKESGTVTGGFAVKVADMDISAFGGGKPSNAGGFGFGKMTYGVGLSMAIGSASGNHPRTTFASDIENAEDAKAKKAALDQTGENSPIMPAKDDYPEMIGADIDPLDALGADEAPDFKGVDARAKKYQADAKVESEDARVERELKELKAAEEQAAQERARLDKIEAAKARRKAVEHAKEDDELMREWMNEAKEETNSVDGISNDDLKWNGLED